MLYFAKRHTMIQNGAHLFMLENLSLLAIIMIVLWVGIFAYYMTISNAQRKLENDIEALKNRLDQDEKNE